jgi:RNA polymerase sigma-70 factor (ECF subfamily)
MLAAACSVWSARLGERMVDLGETGRSSLADNDQSASGARGDENARLGRLLELCGAGDRAAFRSLYDVEAPRLYGLALRITRQPALAADAVHDALLQVWQNAARFDHSRGSAEAWLTSMVRYRALDIVRRRVRETTDASVPERVDTELDPFERLLTMTEGQALHRCLQTLEERQRRAIVLAFVEGLSHTELADRLAVPLGTVKSWIRRGLLALKICLES